MVHGADTVPACDHKWHVKRLHPSSGTAVRGQSGEYFAISRGLCEEHCLPRRAHGLQRTGE